MMNESPDPVAQKWFNTDAGRTIIAAAIVGAFMIITAAAVLIGGANQTQQSGQTTGSQTATPTNPPPAPPTPPPSAPTPGPTTLAPPPPVSPSAPTHTYAPTYTPTRLSGARAEFRCADRVELGGAVELLVQLCTDAWRCGQHYDADNAGIASHLGLTSSSPAPPPSTVPPAAPPIPGWIPGGTPPFA